MAPTLVLVRPQDYSRHDPDLSELGRAQCLDLKKSLMENLKAKGIEVGLILEFPSKPMLDGKNSAKPCDTGSSIESLKAEFPTVDFSKVDPVYPDKTTEAGAHYKFSRGGILNRAQTNIAELHAKSEKAVIIVSHSAFMRLGVTGFWFFNADYRVFDIQEKKDENDVWALKQWEWTQTNAGAMGKSFDTQVALGSDLPDI